MAKRKPKIVAPPPPIRSMEFIQRAEDGGYPCDNSGPFRHGENVRIVAGRDLWDLGRALQADQTTLTPDEKVRLAEVIKWLVSLGPFGPEED